MLLNFITLLAMGILGWTIGSLINYLADVLPYTRKFSPPICKSCETKSSVIHYVFLQPCRICNKPREIRAWVVQFLAVVLTIVVWFFPPDRIGFWIALPYFVFFAVVFLIDFEHRVILHEVSITGAILAIPLGLLLNDKPFNIVIGGVAGFGIMFALYLLGDLFGKFMAKRRGEPIDEVALGFGDVNLCGVLGIILGWPRIGVMIFVSVLLGGLLSGLYILYMVITKKYKPFTAIPYAPFLIIAAVILIYMA